MLSDDYSWSLSGLQDPTHLVGVGVRLNPYFGLEQYINIDYFPIGPQSTIAVKFNFYQDDTDYPTTILSLGYDVVGSISIVAQTKDTIRCYWYGKEDEVWYNREDFLDYSHEWDTTGATYYTLVIVRDNANINVYMNLTNDGELMLIGSAVMSPNGMNTSEDPLFAEQEKGYQIGWSRPSEPQNYMNALIHSFTFWEGFALSPTKLSEQLVIGPPPPLSLIHI